MTDFKLRDPAMPQIVGWRVCTLDKGKYKDHPKKFAIKSSCEEFAELLRKYGKHEKVEIREIFKHDGI